MVGAALGVVLVPISGALSDRVGRKPVFRVGAWLALVVAFPAAALVSPPTPSRSSSVFVAGLGVVYGTVYGPLAAFWSELFDTRYRYTALSTLYQVSGVVASGLTPLIAAWLVSKGDGNLWWVAATTSRSPRSRWCRPGCLPETRGRDLDETVVEAEPVPVAA